MPPIMKNQLLPGRGEARKSCFTCLQLGNIFSRFSVPVTLSPLSSPSDGAPWLLLCRQSRHPSLPTWPLCALPSLCSFSPPPTSLLRLSLPSTFYLLLRLASLSLPPSNHLLLRLTTPSLLSLLYLLSISSYVSPLLRLPLSPPPSNYPTPAPVLRRHPGFCAFGLHTRIPFSASAFDSCCHRFLASRLRPHRH